MDAAPPPAPGKRRSLRNRFTLIVFAAVLFGVIFTWLAPEEEWPVFAQPPALDIPAVTVPKGDQQLVGTVLDPAGQPVPAAVVEVLVDGRPCWGETADDGTFAIEGLTAGAHSAIVLAHGYPPTVRPVQLPLSGPLELSLDPPLTPVAVLPPIARSPLKGRLTPSVGSRIAGCEIVLLPTPDPDAPDAGQPGAAGDATGFSGATMRRVFADGSGAFEFPAVVHGFYAIEVLPAWAAGGSWPVLATTAHRHDAASPALELPLRGARVVASAQDAAGRAVAGALLLVSPEGQPSRVWPPTHTSATGSASIGDLPAGRYRVELHAGEHSAEQVVEIESGLLLEVDFEPLTLR